MPPFVNGYERRINSVRCSYSSVEGERDDEPRSFSCSARNSRSSSPEYRTAVASSQALYIEASSASFLQRDSSQIAKTYSTG